MRTEVLVNALDAQLCSMRKSLDGEECRTYEYLDPLLLLACCKFKPYLLPNFLPQNVAKSLCDNRITSFNTANKESRKSTGKLASSLCFPIVTTSPWWVINRYQILRFFFFQLATVQDVSLTTLYVFHTNHVDFQSLVINKHYSNIFSGEYIYLLNKNTVPII
jgi:hypothetical protein